MPMLGKHSGVKIFLKSEPVELQVDGGEQTSCDGFEKSGDIAIRCRKNCPGKLKKIKFTTI